MLYVRSSSHLVMLYVCSTVDGFAGISEYGNRTAMTPRYGSSLISSNYTYGPTYMSANVTNDNRMMVHFSTTIVGVCPTVTVANI